MFAKIATALVISLGITSRALAATAHQQHYANPASAYGAAFNARATTAHRQLVPIPPGTCTATVTTAARTRTRMFACNCRWTTGARNNSDHDHLRRTVSLDRPPAVVQILLRTSSWSIFRPRAGLACEEPRSIRADHQER
jgi:hypothetical protein